MINENTLLEANSVLETFNDRLKFKRQSRLCLLHRNGVSAVRVAPHSGSLCNNYGRMGMGGTQAMAVGQLARWIRGQTRAPLHWWEHWASPKIALARDQGEEMMELLRKSSYDDGVTTLCVHCGNPRSGDWWCLDGLVGPCCRFGRCQAFTLEAAS